MDDHNKNQNQDKKYIDDMINLILCSGAKPLKVPKLKKNPTYLDSKIMTCYDLLFHTNILNDPNSFNAVSKLRNELKITMHDLCSREKRIFEIHALELNFIPKCLIDIVSQYYVETYVEYIDWDKV